MRQGLLRVRREGRATVVERDAVDARKAAGWSVLAGAAHLAVVAIGHLGYPYVQNALVAVGSGFVLPAIAVLHPRNAHVRASGAVLGTIAGTAAAVIGVGAWTNVDLRPAALVCLGIWWWTIGKLWAETAVMPRSLGIVTAGLGALTLLGAFVEAASIGVLIKLPGAPDLAVWPVAQATQGVWLVALAAALMRPLTDVPSR